MTRPLAPPRMAGLAALAAMIALALPILMDLLGGAVTDLTDTIPAAGLLRGLVPWPAWPLSPPGLATLTGLIVATALGWLGTARLGARRLGGLAVLIGLTVSLAAWAPLVLPVMGFQALALLFDRSPEGARTLPMVTRLLGVVAAILLTGHSPPAMTVAVVCAALAPDALATLARPLARQPDGTEQTSTTGTQAPPSASEIEAEAATAPPAARESSGAAGSSPTAIVDATPPAEAHAGPHALFGTDPVTALAHLTPADHLLETARDILADGRTPIVAVLRLDGLTGIAEHLGVGGGEDLFAVATERLAQALPADGVLSWLGDETFAALLPSATANDMEALETALTAPFIDDMIIDGRPISMEDALHVDAAVVDEAILDELGHLISPARRDAR